MPPRLHDISYEAFEAFSQRWNVETIALFGSVLREDFSGGSDVDVLVTFQKGAQPSLFDLTAMQDELEALMGRKVDLMTRRGVEQSYNWIRRRAILDEAQTVYQAGGG